MNKISGVYKITNTVTGEFYIGSSKNIKRRWYNHKCKSTWKKNPNSPLYRDMQKYGIDKFRFQILVPVIEEYLTQVEQECIEMLKPTYNDRHAKGLDVRRRKKTQKEYFQSEKGREASNKSVKKYSHKLCVYNGETLTLDALRARFQRAGIPHPSLEAKKYLEKQ